MLTPDRVKAARKLLHWSQIKLAVEADISYATVAKFERGEPSITERKIRAIHDTLVAAGLHFPPGLRAHAIKREP